MLASVRPRDIAGKTRRRIAAEELAELIAVEAKIKKATAELKAMVLARGSRLMDLHGVGPVVAARILADVGDVARFADRNRFASWTGTAPLDASSGEQNRHRLSRAGNRRMNHMIHIAAVTQLRLDTDGPRLLPTQASRRARSRWRRSAASSDGSPTPSTASSSPTPPRAAGADPGGHCGATQESSAVDLPPHIDTSDQPLPGPANPTLRRTKPTPEEHSKPASRRPLTTEGSRYVGSGRADQESPNHGTPAGRRGNGTSPAGGRPAKSRPDGCGRAASTPSPAVTFRFPPVGGPVSRAERCDPFILGVVADTARGVRGRGAAWAHQREFGSLSSSRDGSDLTHRTEA